MDLVALKKGEGREYVVGGLVGGRVFHVLRIGLERRESRLIEECLFLENIASLIPLLLVPPQTPPQYW